MWRKGRANRSLGDRAWALSSGMRLAAISCNDICSCATHAEGLGEAMLRRDTVLVVDHSPETLGFLTDTLDSAGYSVLIATDTASALELVDRITPDLVLMDAVSAPPDGFEACRRLKHEKLLGDLPVIFMTGSAQTDQVIQGLTAGGVDCVAKPIVVNELLARIRVHLDNARITKGSHIALDATGSYLLSMNHAGHLNWCTPKARELLLKAYPERMDRDNTLPAMLIEQLLRLLRNSSRSSTQSILEFENRRLEITFLCTTGPDENLFCMTEAASLGEHEILQMALPLTAREAEVLLWVSRGKSNRDIGQILTISPRTINKHLERVFEKLGVENRASAAVQAVRTLASHRSPSYATASIPS